MTTAIVSIALLFAPPVQEVEHPSWAPTSLPPAPIVVNAPAISFFDYSTLPIPEATPPLSAPIESPAPAVEVPKTPQQLVDEIFGWPGPQLVQCESGWNQWAVGAAGERGLFQVAPLWRPVVERLGWTWDQMFEVEPNIRMALHIRQVQGLRAWTCYRG